MLDGGFYGQTYSPSNRFSDNQFYPSTTDTTRLTLYIENK